jgi:D-lactate dehydrogenase (cytochrome)
LRPGAQSVSTDVCVPISRLAECVEATQKDIEETGIPAPIVGHVGDGNFHLGLMFFPDDPHEMAQVKPFLQRLVKRALAMEGTCTGEHGVGQQKIGYMGLEHSDATLDIMRGIKRQLDPLGIMNPHKVLPET